MDAYAFALGTDLRLIQAALADLTKFENFFPKFVVLRKLLVISNGQRINLFRSHLVGGLDIGMRGYAAAEGHSFLSFLSEDPTVP